MKKHAIRGFAVIIAALVISVSGVATTAIAAPQGDVVSLTNQQRTAAGQPALIADPALNAVAQEWAQNMANQGAMVHSTNQWRAERIPSGWYTNGENMAVGSGYPSASAVVSGWMNSPGHRQNILRSSFTHIGVGYVASGNYWVQIFAGYSEESAPRVAPIGSLDDASAALQTGKAVISLRGWAIDPIYPTRAIDVHVYITDPTGVRSGYPVAAVEQRPDVAAVYPKAGSNHGYSFQTDVTVPGTYQVCVYGIGVPRTGSVNSTLGCRSLAYEPGKPIGNVERLDVTLIDGTPTLSIRGWALDNAARSTATEAHVYVFDPAGKPVGTAVRTTVDRPDVAAAYPGAGSAHGFTFVRPLTQPGAYTVCVYAMSAPQFGTSNKQLTCRPVRLGPSNLVGAFDAAEYRAVSKELDVSGWSIDLGLPTMVNATHVYVTSPSGTSTGYALRSDTDRPDVARAFSAAGAAHGFRMTVPATQPGSYRVCAYGIANPLLGTGNISLGCKAVIAG